MRRRIRAPVASRAAPAIASRPSEVPVFGRRALSEPPMVRDEVDELDDGEVLIEPLGELAFGLLLYVRLEYALEELSVAGAGAVAGGLLE